MAKARGIRETNVLAIEAVPAPAVPSQVWPRWRDAPMVTRIAERMSEGCSGHTAGSVEGLAENTVDQWLSKLRAEIADILEAGGELSEFAKAVTPIARARAEFFARMEVLAASGDAGAQWVLPRRMPSVWGQQQASQVVISDGSREVAALLQRLTGD